MAHLCPTCSETCYCMGDFTETLSGHPSYCKHCTEYENDDVFNFHECIDKRSSINKSIKNIEPYELTFEDTEDDGS